MKAEERKEQEWNAKGVYKTRWGWVPCDYLTYLELKLIYKYYWEAVYKAAKHERWLAKKPHNRVGPEPELCDIFEKHPGGRDYGYIKEQGAKYDFWRATSPKDDPEEVESLYMPEGFREDLYYKLCKREDDQWEKRIHIEKSQVRPARSVRQERMA